jgi:hypothetical protein
MDIPGITIPGDLMDIQPALDRVFEDTPVMCLIQEAGVHLLEGGKHGLAGKLVQMVEHSITGGDVILFCPEMFCSVFNIGVFSNCE